ncbi:MAG: hypothetical protein R2739_10630 [Chitinophagales bacterium]
MKSLFHFVLCLFIFVGCNSSSNNSSGNTSSKNGGKFWQKMTMHELKDNSGMVAAIMPLPSSWEIHIPPKNGVSISGPDNIKVTDFAPKSFMMNYDPNLQYAYEQSGVKMREMPSIDQLVQEDVVPSAAKLGLSYIKHYELPEVSKMDKWYSDQLYKVGPTETYNKAFGIDFKNKEGDPVFVILHVNSSKSEYLQNWYYMSSMLEADADEYELAKKQLIFALANTRYNLEPIMAYNKKEAQRIGQSWAAFNKKMAARQAAFEASQLEHVNRTNAINDAIMSNWKSKNAAMDKNQEQFVDYIYENENVQNVETGKTYKVQQGANQYWMNNDGEYIGTKSNTYDPNLDDNMNDQKWQELKKIDK